MSYHKIVRCNRCGKETVYTETVDDYEKGYRLFSFTDHHEQRHFNLCPECMKWFYNEVNVKTPWRNEDE